MAKVNARLIYRSSLGRRPLHKMKKCALENKIQGADLLSLCLLQVNMRLSF
jgi:hypothetical protein